MKNASVKILRASAGSGKTYRLAYEYIKRVVADPHSYRSILAVTFTNKATQEMKSRIIESLNALANFSDGAQVVYMDDLTRDLKLSEREVQRAAKVAKKYILHDYSNFAVSTIDKFFQRITRSFFKELGFDFGYEVELSSEHFLEKAVANVIQQSSGDENLTRLLERVVSRELESNKWNIRNRLIAIGKVLTRDNYRQNDNHDSADLATIMDMIAELHHAKEAQLRNIAAQWIDTLHQDNIEVEDVSFKETGFAGFIDKIARGGEIKPSSKRVINALNQDMKDWLSKAAQKAGKRVTDASLRDLLEQFVEQNHEFQLFNNSFRAANRHFDSRLLIDRLALELDKLMGQSNRLPIHRTTGLVAQIAENTEIPFIYEKLGTTYNTYMIDEFQDTSTSQWQGFLPLLQEVISHSGDQAVLLIGDVKQAIYRWRGGDWNILDSQAIRSFNAKNVDQNESLDTNWRSLRNIVDFNNDLFRSVIEIDSQEIDSFAAQSQLSDYNSILQNAYATYKQSPRPHSTGGYVELKITDEPLQETIRAIEELTTKHNYQLRDIAVLVRSNSEGEKMANNLISANYNVISDEALKISSSPTVRFVINIIKLSIDPSDAIAQAEVNLYRYNQINATDDEQSKEFVKSLSLLSAVSAFEAIIQHFSLQNKEISYLQALYQALYNYSVSTSGDLAHFIEWWDESGKNISLSLPKEQNAITIISIHKSKGLQFPAVIIPWCNWSLLPLPTSKIWVSSTTAPFSLLSDTLVEYNKSLAQSYYVEDYVRESIYSHIDAINMLYVAVTRAEEALYMFTPEVDTSKEGAVRSVADLLNRHLCAITASSNSTIYRHGELSVHAQKPKQLDSESINLVSLHSWDPSSRIATKLPHHQVENSGDSLDNRHYGILMHDILSKIETLDDIEEVIQNKRLSGDIVDRQSVVLAQKIDQAINSDQIRDWFSPRWTVVNERGIILPKSNTSRRPDRVLIDQTINRVVVIDYKFGLPSPKHQAQVREYGSILRAMNYSSVECFLWYVAQNEVVDCTP